MRRFRRSALELEPSDGGASVCLVTRHTDGAGVPAPAIAGGVLLTLAFQVLLLLPRGDGYVVEHPERGLHPARIPDVVRVLENLGRSAHVVVLTQSPLVVNAFDGHPHDVLVVTSRAVVSLDETHNFRSRSKASRIGELWLMYADGIDESALLTGGDAIEGRAL